MTSGRRVYGSVETRTLTFIRRSRELGVIAFLFADLIVLPILDIYRRYYGLKIAAVLLGVAAEADAAIPQHGCERDIPD